MRSSPLRLSAFFCRRANTSSSLDLIFLWSSIISPAKMQSKLLRYFFHFIGFIRTKFERDTYSTVQYSCRWTSASLSFRLTVFWDSLFRLPGLWWREKKTFVLTTYVNCKRLLQAVNIGWICFPLLIISNLACVCFSFCIFSVAISSCWANILSTKRRKWSDQIDSVHSFQTQNNCISAVTITMSHSVWYFHPFHLEFLRSCYSNGPGELQAQDVGPRYFTWTCALLQIFSDIPVKSHLRNQKMLLSLTFNLFKISILFCRIC